MKKIFRDAELQKAFERQGYVVVQVLTPDEATFLREKAKELLPANPQINDPQNAYYGSYFDVPIRKHVSDFLKDYLAYRLGATVDGYRPRFSTYLLKHAGASHLEPHQHNPYIADFLETVINVWIPLDQCSANEGVLQVVPNSHKIHWHLQTCQNDTYFGHLGQRLQDKYLVDFHLQPGQAVIFEDSMIHGSAPNSSDNNRLAVLVTLVPEESQPAFYIEGEVPGAPFQVVAAPHEFAHADMGMHMLPPRTEWQILGELPDRNSVVTEEELDWLLASGRKIGPNSHPLEEFRAQRRMDAAATPPGHRPSLPRRAIGKMRRVLKRFA